VGGTINVAGNGAVGGNFTVTGGVAAASGLGYPTLVFQSSGFTGSGPTTLGGLSALAAPAGGYYLTSKAGTIRNMRAMVLADDGSGYVNVASSHTVRFTVKIGTHDGSGAITSSSTAFTLDVAGTGFANIIDGLDQSIAYASDKIIYVQASTIGGSISACTVRLEMEVQE
jgi:hypothetical protein